MLLRWSLDVLDGEKTGGAAAQKRRVCRDELIQQRSCLLPNVSQS